MMNNILQYLEATAERLPDKIAFYDNRESLTFAQLMDQSRRIGSSLSKIGKPDTPVALFLDPRSIRNLPALFGVLYAGCAYAPLDISMPPERLNLLLDRLQPSAILVDEKGKKALQGCENIAVPVLTERDAAQEELLEDKLLQIRTKTSVYDPASILFTSGSTGIPKGSIQNHFSYIHWTEATIAMYGLDENTVLANQSPFFYANSILEIFPPVALGATVYMLPGGVLTFPQKMIECLNEHHVTELCMTPSSFIAVANSGVLTPGCLPQMKWGIMSGESMPWQPLRVWMDATPNADWWHFYGSTEMFSVAVGKVDKTHAPEGRLPVGKPFPLVHILFMDENGDPVEDGTPGEMYVSSPWIARGYHRDEARSRDSWVIDPLKKGRHERFYRAGDIGYLRADGQLMVLGRRDTQIKHMGYRMELGEVEAALRAIDGWKDGCVLYQPQSDRIWCFFIGELDEKSIRQALKGSLARYMIPDVFVHLDELPHTASMKLNRSALLEMMH